MQYMDLKTFRWIALLLKYKTTLHCHCLLMIEMYTSSDHRVSSSNDLVLLSGSTMVSS